VRPAARWLNLVERWSALITSQAVRRSSFASVVRLDQAVTRFLAHWNEHPFPSSEANLRASLKRSIHDGTLIYEAKH
jgi:hypothetical protein